MPIKRLNIREQNDGVNLKNYYHLYKRSIPVYDYLVVG